MKHSRRRMEEPGWPVKPGTHQRPGAAARWGLLCLAVALGSACGKRGAPLPPEPRGPLAPTGVAARQIGEEVEVHFQVPSARGAKPAQQTVRAELIRLSYAPGSAPPPDAGAFRRRGRLVDATDGNPLPANARVRLVDRLLDELPDRGRSRTLRYAVRVRDRRGRPSPLVAAQDLVPLEPVAAPRRLVAEPTVDGIRLVWAPPPGGERLQYNLYRKTGDGAWPSTPLNTDPVAATEYLDSAVVSGESYVYRTRASLAAGRPYREGLSSEPVSVRAEDLYPPATPQGLIVVQEGGAVRLFWDPNRDPDLAGYRVYRRPRDGDWERIGPDLVEQPLYLDRDPPAGSRLGYRVTAIDRASPPNESPPSETLELEMGTEPGTER